jgi:hypothetical protein
MTENGKDPLCNDRASRDQEESLKAAWRKHMADWQAANPEPRGAPEQGAHKQLLNNAGSGAQQQGGLKAPWDQFMADWLARRSHSATGVKHGAADFEASSSNNCKRCKFCSADVPSSAQKCQSCGEWLIGRGGPLGWIVAFLLLVMLGYAGYNMLTNNRMLSISRRDALSALRRDALEKKATAEQQFADQQIVDRLLSQMRKDFCSLDNGDTMGNLSMAGLDHEMQFHPRHGRLLPRVSVKEACRWAERWMSAEAFMRLQAIVNRDKYIWFDAFDIEVL